MHVNTRGTVGQVAWGGRLLADKSLSIWRLGAGELSIRQIAGNRKLRREELRAEPNAWRHDLSAKPPALSGGPGLIARFPSAGRGSKR